MKTIIGNPFDFDNPWEVEEYPAVEEDELLPYPEAAPEPEPRVRCCSLAHWNEAGGLCCHVHYPNTCGWCVKE